MPPVENGIGTCHLELLGGSESGGTNKIVRTCAAHLRIETDVK